MYKPSLYAAALLSLALAFPASAPAQVLEPFADGFNRPLFLTHAGDESERLFVVEQAGRIYMRTPDAPEWTLYLDLQERVLSSGNEQGLLGMAFHPEFATNGYFFVNYTFSRPGGSSTRIARFRADAPFIASTGADPDSEVAVLEFEQTATNHNGGYIGFSPVDGYLYIASGDGGGGNDPQQAGQNLGTLLGKMLRIDVGSGTPEEPLYTVPASNPFADGAGGALPEIWAYGLRNPYRSSFDQETGDLYIADVGQNAIEEINWQPASSTGGENYGWRIFEGTRCNTTVVSQEACDDAEDGLVFPIHEYPNPDDGRSVTGGYVYRGSAIPAWQGRYFFGDYLSARVWSFRVTDGQRTDFQENTSALDPEDNLLGLISSFGEDEQGELYVVSLGGSILKIVPEDTGEGEGEGTGAVFHSADRNQDNEISLSELLRVIQFFNSDGYQCAAGTEDGYAPNQGDTDCMPHDSDYNPQDWQIDLSELLRMIQFFNSPGYFWCPDASTEDGYCVTQG